MAQQQLFAAEHRKRRRRRRPNGIRQLCHQRSKEERRQKCRNWHMPLLRVFLLYFLLIFAQFVHGTSAITTHSTTTNTAPGPADRISSQFNNNSGPKEENSSSSVEIFTKNIWRIEAENVEEETAEEEEGMRTTPKWEWQALLKNSKNKGMCHVWNAGSPSELCARNSWHRIRRMRELSLFIRCPEGYANLQLIDIFQLDWRAIRTEEDLLSHSEHLRIGSDGQSCLLAAAESRECLACFNKLNLALERLEKAFWSFSNLLRRFDCRLVTKQQPKVEISATRPFSPNTTCHNCAEWYRKWLLINLVGIWKKRPCINWCYYTQLACPHLATNKVVEFAGHPVFLCRDQRLSAVDQRNLLMNCSCLHPCDLIQNRIAQFDLKAVPMMDNGGGGQQQSFDFFHVSAYCQNREKICSREHGAG